MSPALGGWITCPCGKVHQRTGIGVDTRCTCGERLWLRLFGGAV